MNICLEMINVLLYLAWLHGRESNVSKELSWSRGGQVETGSVEEGVLLSNHVGVDLLEHLVESKLAETLGRVTNGSGGPAQEQSRSSALSNGHLETISKTLVLLLVNLENDFVFSLLWRQMQKRETSFGFLPLTQNNNECTRHHLMAAFTQL